MLENPNLLLISIQLSFFFFFFFFSLSKHITTFACHLHNSEGSQRQNEVVTF